MPVGFADKLLPRTLPVQGNLDPIRLRAGGAQLAERTRDIVAGFANRPHIFNLGHGILPETPIAHVEELVRLVKEGN
jgi:uroporphyrinogen decarboxylase